MDFDTETSPIENRQGLELLGDGFKRVKEVLAAGRLHFPLPFELLCPKEDDETDEEYYQLMKFAIGEPTEFSPDLAISHQWKDRLLNYGATLLAFICQRAALDNIMAMAFSVKPAAAKSDMFVTNIQQANAALLMAARACKTDLADEAEEAKDKDEGWGNYGS